MKSGNSNLEQKKIFERALMTLRWLILIDDHVSILSCSSGKIIASSFRIKRSDLHHLHSTCLKSGGICSGFLPAAGNRAELMGLMPCVPRASCLSSFWNMAGSLRSLPAVASGQGRVQRCGCKQSAITHTIVMLWSRRFMCKTDSEMSLLTPPIRRPASGPATAQSENGVRQEGVKNLTKSHRVSFPLSPAWWAPISTQREFHLHIGGTRWLYNVTVHAGKPPLQLAVSRRLSVATVLDSGTAYRPQRGERGCQTKGGTVTCDSHCLISDNLSHPLLSRLIRIINNEITSERPLCC